MVEIISAARPFLKVTPAPHAEIFCADFDAVLLCGAAELGVFRRDGIAMPASQTGATLFSGWGESLAAVVAGNLAYFLVVPVLPAALRHELFRLDAGLFLDFVFCGVALVVIRRVRRAS